jgi:hypothetical protein
MRHVSLAAAAMILAGALALPATAAPSITIAPGIGPAGGYVPLSSVGGTAVPFMDEQLIQFATPTFTWAGQSWDALGVSSNGYAVIGLGGINDLTNQQLPDPIAPNNVLAPFWTDLNPAQDGDIYIGTVTDGLDTWIVVDWAAVPVFGSLDNFQSFEIWIRIHGGASGDGEQVTFSYGQISLPPNVTIGAEDASGTVGANYYVNGAGTPIASFSELVVATSGFGVAAVPEPAGAATLLASLAALSMLRNRRRPRAR